jgi:hypothetical protein
MKEDEVTTMPTVPSTSFGLKRKDLKSDENKTAKKQKNLSITVRSNHENHFFSQIGLTLLQKYDLTPTL